MLGRIHYHLTGPAGIVTISTLCVLLMLLSSLPSPSTWQSTGLRTDAFANPLAQTNDTLYPYIVNVSDYPSPYRLMPFTTGNYTSPQLTSAVVNQAPEFLLLAVHTFKNGTAQAFFQTGAYSATLANEILTKAVSYDMPIQWGTAVAVGAWTTGFAGDALAASSNGSVIFAAVSYGTSTNVYESVTDGSSWTLLTATAITGTSPRLSFGGSAALLSTITSSQEVIATTFYLHGTPSIVSKTLSVTAIGAAVGWLPSLGMGEEAVVVSTSSDLLELFDSVDGGNIFASSTIGNFTPSSNTSAFNSVGSTRIWYPGGLPGQVAVATSGTTLFVLYTTFQQGQVIAGTLSSYDEGAQWVGPYFTALSAGSISQPSVVPSPAGYFYGIWVENSLGNWGVDAVVFSGDGRVIQSPALLPDSNSTSVNTTWSSVVTVDSLQRPFYVWSTVDRAGTGVLRFSGAYLNPSSALHLLRAYFDYLQPWDYKSAVLSGSKGSLARIIDNWVNYTVTNVTDYESSHTTSKYLCQAQNNTADSLYVNVTHIQFAYVSGSPVCGNLNYAVTETNSTNANGTPKIPLNYVVPTVAMTLGPLAANSYLAVIADWALESIGVTVSWSADPLRTFVPTSNVLPWIPVSTVTASRTLYSVTSTLHVLPQPVNPITGLLNTTGSMFPPFRASWTSGTTHCDGATIPIDYTEYSYPYEYYSNVTVEGNSGSYSSATGLPSVYLTELAANSTVTWSGSFTAAYEGEVNETVCTGHFFYYYIPPDNVTGNIPTRVTLDASGTLTTSLRMYYPPAQMSLVANSHPTNVVYDNWTNTMPANDSALSTNISGSSFNHTISSPDRIRSYADSLAVSFKSPPLQINAWYSVALNASSENGQGSPQPGLSAEEMTSAPPLAAQWACTFQLTNNPVAEPQMSVTNYTAGNMTVQWSSNVPDTTTAESGWVTYSEFGVGINLTQTAQALVNGSTNDWKFIAELHGIAPSSFYNITATTAVASGCLTFENSAHQVVSTLHNLQLTEIDYPYDSISKTGGGAALEWTLPRNITNYANFVNGTVTYTNESNASKPTIMVPLTQLFQVQPGGSLYEVNLTGLGLNSSYSASVTLNYTLKTAPYTSFSFGSSPCAFIYGLDSSGDGLTNAEKARGWWVPVQNAFGGYSGSGSGGTWVWANAQDYATNGLVSDYVEKEFDLDPNTVDTAGSHMLDTWNLTFNLGKGSPALPTSGFEYWYENSTFNPFVTAALVAYNKTNISASPGTYGITSGDGSSWAARALWSTTALTTFESLPGVQAAGWLRAVTGTWKGIRTLTVWGKLSWGADPLAASTVFDGIPDGERVNPVCNESLEIASLSSTETGLSNGNGFAVEFTVRNGTATSGTPERQNYSAPTIVSSSSKSISGYTVSIPVSQTFQNQTLQVEVIANESNKYYALPFNGAHWEANISLDMVNGAPVTYAQTTGSGSKYATLSFTLERAATGRKATTWLWLPTTNSTTNGLPLGLERYTGEQAFDLVVVNASSSMSLTGVPFPWGSTYAVNLTQGLNSFIVPREQFLNSTFGEAILRGFASPYTSGANPAMIANGSASWDSIHGFGGSNLVVDLASYWQNRAIYTSAGAIDPTTETGTSNASSQSIHALAVESATANNTGGDPGDPALENSTASGAALQAVLTMNVTNTTQLQLLLAGLLDNSTGGLNGTFQNITLQVPFIGLAAPVTNALANQATAGEGLYGAPTTSTPGQTSPSSSLWGAFWDAFTAVALSVTHTLLSLIEVAWSITVEAFTYFNHLFRAALALGGAVLHRTAAALEVAGRALVNATRALLTAIGDAALSALSLVLNPVWQTCVAYGESLVTIANHALSDLDANGSVPGDDSDRFWQALSGPVFIIALSLTIAIEVVLTAILPISLGATFVIGALLGLILSGVMTYYSSRVSVQIPSGSGYTQPVAAMVWSAATVSNTTKVNGTVAPDTTASNYTPTWRTLADIFGWIWGPFSFSLAWASFWGAFIDPTGFIAPAVGLAAAIVALILSFVTIQLHSFWLFVISAGVAMLSIACDAYSILKKGGTKMPMVILNAMTAIGDIVTFSILIGENHDHLA